MKQVIQDLRNGDTNVVEVPTPSAGPGRLQICTSTSLVSAGTERMLVAFGRGNVMAKVRQQPDKVRQVLDKVRMTDCCRRWRRFKASSGSRWRWGTATSAG